LPFKLCTQKNSKVFATASISIKKGCNEIAVIEAIGPFKVSF